MNEEIIRAKVEEIAPLTDSIVKLILVPESFIPYQAGQYLQVLLDGEAFSYSIANAPLGAGHYELHIRHGLDNPCTQSLLASIKEHGVLQLRLPFGVCSLSHLDPIKPIIFIAAGTGFAPIKAMIEQLLINADPRHFELFWGARSRSDLYWDSQVNQWKSHIAHFDYVSLLTGQSKDTLASCVVKKHSKDLDAWQMVISGPFDMVYSTRDVLVNKGVSVKHLFSDAFSFEMKS